MTTIVFTTLSFIQVLSRNLWLSLSSIKFYQNILRHFSGSGIKYIVNLSMISSFLCCIILIIHINKIKDYLINDIVTDDIKEIEHVISHLPQMEYNGTEISIADGEEAVIHSFHISNIRLVTIDPEHKLSIKDRNKSFILLLKNKMIINFFNADGTIHTKLPIQYKQILGSESLILTSNEIKAKLSQMLALSSNIYLYITFIFVSLVICLNILFDKSLIIIILFFVIKLFKVKKTYSMQTITRIVLYASGPFVLLNLPLRIITPYFYILLLPIQILTHGLMLVAIYRILTTKNK